MFRKYKSSVYKRNPQNLNCIVEKNYPKLGKKARKITVVPFRVMLAS